MSRTAKATLFGSLAASSAIVFGVHLLQVRERETMYRGVERDEARRAEKRQLREEQQKQQQQQTDDSASTWTFSNAPLIQPLPPSESDKEGQERAARERVRREQDLLRNQERYERFQKIQPTRAWIDARSTTSFDNEENL